MQNIVKKKLWCWAISDDFQVYCASVGASHKSLVSDHSIVQTLVATDSLTHTLPLYLIGKLGCVIPYIQVRTSLGVSAQGQAAFSTPGEIRVKVLPQGFNADITLLTTRSEPATF